MLRIYSLAFELITHCNLRCPHCYNAVRGGQEQNERNHVFRVLERIDHVLGTVQLDHATLTGGEPLVFSGLLDVVDKMKVAGVPCQIISNGTQLEEALARRLVQGGVRGIQISLHGPDAKSHEAFTAVVGSFDRTVAGVRAARKAGLPVTGCIVITRRNARFVKQTLAFWRRLGIIRVALSRFSPAGLAGGHVARLLPSLPDVVAAFDQALPFAKDGMKLFSTMPVPPCAMDTKSYAPIRFGSCAIGTNKQEFALGPGGELRNCTLHSHPIGGVRDILQSDLPALLKHPDVSDYRKCVPEFCHGCLHAGTCGGGCGASSGSVLGSRDRPDPFLWQHLDDDFEAWLKQEGARNDDIDERR